MALLAEVGLEAAQKADRCCGDSDTHTRTRKEIRFRRSSINLKVAEEAGINKCPGTAPREDTGKQARI